MATPVAPMPSYWTSNKAGAAESTSSTAENSYRTGRQTAQIDKAEERAISLLQLREIWTDVERLHSQWKDAQGITLGFSTNDINLYHVNHNMIRPWTCDLQCSFVELIARAPQPTGWFVSHYWGDNTHALLACLAEHLRLHHLGCDTAFWICAVSIAPVY